MSESPLERFRQVDALFDAALDVPPDERADFVSRRSAGEDSLRDAVMRLLEAHDASDDFLGGAAVDVAMPFLPDAWLVAAVPTAVGPFRIVREIGRGGMGTVFLAERADGEFEQRVALKFLRALGGDEALVRRFREERRILARLEHPRIARLLDGGVASDGTPWFAMEYVEGERIDEWCDARALPIDGRLALFGAMCEVVQYAHQQLVVHRDLKPSNVLVTADGEVKLLDFGIAKLLEASAVTSAGDEPAPRTMTTAMTPQYAAPEQIRGETISAATDVYALGVLLYELLTGRRPYDVRGRTAAEVERIVCESEPPRPSSTFDTPRRGAPDDGVERARARGSTPRALRRRLHGDLDAIVMQALRKEPSRRYPSAAAMLGDLQRLRAGHPVLARTDSVAYRTRRFVSRHRTGLVAAGVVVAALVAGMARERTLRQRAEAQARKATAVEQYMISVFDVSDPYAVNSATNADISARALLERGEARIARDLAGQSDAQAALRGALARVYGNLGLVDRAADQARRALEQQRARLGPRHPEVAVALDQLGELLTQQERYDEAEPLLRDALAQQREFLGDESPTTVSTSAHLGALLQERGDLAQAEPILRHVLASRRRAAVTAADSIVLTNAINDLAVLLFVRGKYDEAEPLDREALAASAHLLGEDHPATAMTVQNLAQVQQLRGHLDEAEALFRRALAAKRRALGNAHPSVTISLNNLGAFLQRDRAKPEEADTLIREAIALDRQIFGDRHGYVAAGLNNLANVQRSLGHPEEAARLGREAVSIAKAVYPGANKETAVYLNGVGASLLAMGDLAGSAAAFRDALAQYREALGEGHLFTQTVAVNLARVLLELGDVTGAATLFRGATVTLDSTVGSNRTLRLAADVGSGQVMTARGQARGAVSLLERAAASIREASGPSHWRTAESELALGRALMATGDRARAEPLLRDAVRVLEPQARSQGRMLAAARRELDKVALTGGSAR